MVILHLSFILGLHFRTVLLYNGILPFCAVCGSNSRIPWETALHWENHHLSWACENFFKVLNFRRHFSWTRWKCCSIHMEQHIHTAHPSIPQKHSSYASTTYNTQKRTRSLGTMDWDGICTAHLFIYIQLFTSHGSASTLRWRVSLHSKRINNKTLKWKDDAKTKYKRLRRKYHTYYYQSLD